MTTRRITVALLALAVLAVAVVVLRPGGATIVHAEFTDAGQLVDGAVVAVAGHKVGSVKDISLTPDGHADVVLSIADARYAHLRSGTRARIRANGQAGVTNRFVDLVPGPDTAPALPAPVTLRTNVTSGIVDLDAVFNTFTPTLRQDVQALVRHGDELYAGSGSRYLNGVLAKLSPALAATANLGGQLTTERGALERLVQTTGATATALADRPPALEDAVTRTAQLFTAVARRRRALGDDITRLHAVLPRATRTLGLVDRATPAVRAALRAVPATAPPLDRLLRGLPTASARVASVADRLVALAPALRATFRGLRPLQRDALPAFRATAPALTSSLPILDALRVYMPDLVLGVFGGLGGVASANYDAQGHYGRIIFVGSPEVAPSGLFSAFPGFKIPGALEVQKDAIAPCPGGGAAPAPDKSNVWVPTPGLCDLKDNHP